MKRCPKCRRDYFDDSLHYCLDDGTALLEGPASGSEPPASAGGKFADEPQTAIMSVSGAAMGFRAGESPTEVFSSSEIASPEDGNSIAVLPFKNISADPDNEYFCEGLAEELLNALAKLDGLKVAARSSAFSFKGKNADISEVGRKLGVASVLEGSVRKSGERLRIAIQLLNASDGYHVWSETYDREMRDIFDVQDEIRLAVIDALKLKLLGDAKSCVLRRETENTEAYKAYLKGRHLRWAKNDHHGASMAYEEAVRLDPLHAPSWLGVAETCILQAHYALIDPREACSRARAALATARELHGESAEALYIEGFAAFIERNWTACDKAYRRAIKLEPNNSRALGTFGIINCVLGNIDEAVGIFSQAREGEPLAAYTYAMTGVGLAAARRSADALPFFEQALAFEPDQTLALWGCCMANIASGKFEEGIAAAERSVAVSRHAGFFLGLLAWALAAAGRTDEAKGLLEEMREGQANSSFPYLSFEACLLGEFGDKDAAFEVLSRDAERFIAVAYYLGLPCYDSLRGDPRFSAFAESLGIPHTNL